MTNELPSITGKLCLNCGKKLFYDWGDEMLLKHDKLHGDTTGWIELQETKAVFN